MISIPCLDIDFVGKGGTSAAPSKILVLVLTPLFGLELFAMREYVFVLSFIRITFHNLGC